MALNEYKAEKQFYKMGEIAEMFDVKLSLIRFWSERFDVLKPQRNKKGNRLFTPQDVKNLELIYHLTRERGMTLAGVDKYLKNNKEEAERDTEIVRRLQTVRALLAEIRQELKEGPDDVEEEGEVVKESPDYQEFTEDTIDPVPDMELSVPFLVQPLFALGEEAEEVIDNEGVTSVDEEERSSVVDTQQSLF